MEAPGGDLSDQPDPCVASRHAVEHDADEGAGVGEEVSPGEGLLVGEPRVHLEGAFD